MATEVVMVNGQLQPVEAPHLNVRDRGFLLGDGLFETIRARKGQVVRLERHLARLRSGAEVIGLPIGWSDDELAELIRQALRAGDLAEAVVRLTVSRGVSPTRGLPPSPNPSPTLVIHAAPFAGYPDGLYEQGMRAIVSGLRRNEQSPLTGVKSLSYLEQILARREATAKRADEALLLNTKGDLAGASAANLFVLVGDRFGTPTLGCGALPGTVRSALLEAFPGLVVERPVPPAEVLAAAEVFLTNALLGIMPLTAVDDRPIGSGRPGERTRALGAALAQLEAR